MSFETTLAVKRLDERFWALTSDLVYRGQDQTFRVPAGFVTDFASVPPFMRGIIDDTGKWTLAAIVHDYLITYRINALDDLSRVSSRDTDGIFRRIMREEGVSWLARWVMWTGVRWGALFSPARRPGRGFAADLPKILPLSLAALVLFSVPALSTMLLRGFLKLIKF